MQKENNVGVYNCNPKGNGNVGARLRPCPNNRGITLIALVITIIVMLILVAVTISMAVNGGLFEYAGKAVGDTENEINKEQELGNGGVTIDGTYYNSIDEYLATKGGSGETGTTMLSYEETAKDTNGFLTANATYTSGDYTAVIPKGFKVSEVEGEKEIATGLVVIDQNNNQFVWVPVTRELENEYIYSEDNYSEPTNLEGINSTSGYAYDSQEILNYYYGEGYYTWTENMYATEYAEMVESVNKNNGFYIGRYETTIDDEGNIGSEYNTTVLTAGTTLFTKDSTDYPYRWYGLYNEQKNADVTGNGTNVQTAMIYGVLWDETMQFIRDQYVAGNTTYTVDEATEGWHSTGSLVKSGQEYEVDSSYYPESLGGDIALSIWGLEANACEWTQEAYSTDHRVLRGGHYYSAGSSGEASWRYGGSGGPSADFKNCSSRLALYIQ